MFALSRYLFTVVIVFTILERRMGYVIRGVLLMLC